jgi:hypothetical protein
MRVRISTTVARHEMRANAPNARHNAQVTHTWARELIELLGARAQASTDYTGTFGIGKGKKKGVTVLS